MIQHALATAPAAARPACSSVAPADEPAALPTLLLRPPYQAAEPFAPVGDPAPLERMPGAVLAVAVCRPTTDPHAIEAAARQLSRRIPSCPVVVLLRMPPEEALETAARLSPLPLRAVVPETASLAPLLRASLTDPTRMPEDVVAWLRRGAVPLNANTAELIQSILALAPIFPSVASLLERCHVPTTTARLRLHKKGLPPPSRWFQAARALHAALYLQAHPDAPARAAAYRLGLADHSALVHLLRRTFRTGVREIRGTLGWEWLLHRWLAQPRGSRPHVVRP
jgi:AraC-like DNA-binding protein